MSKLINVKVSDLRIHPSYEKIYELENYQRVILKDSILRTNGLLNPIVINSKNYIVHGTQRFLSYQELGRDTIPAVLNDSADDVDETFMMISYNRHKDKSMLERWNEISYLKSIYKKKQGQRTDLHEGTTDFDKLSTRAKIALHCNIAEGNVYKIEKVAELKIELLNFISSGEISLHEAYERVTGKSAKLKESSKAENDNGEAVTSIYNYCCPKCKHEFNL